MIAWQELHDFGFSVFPLKPRDKRPAGAWEKYQRERPFADDLREWSADPASNAAVATGAVSGVFVVDLDSAEAQRAFFARGVPRTPQVTTAKGCHVYFRHPGIPVKNSAGRIGAGIDVRGDGGYVVAAGSVHPTGARYEWCPSPAEVPFADAPAWLIAEIMRADPPATVEPGRAPGEPNRYVDAALDREVAKLRTAREGTRNDTLNVAAMVFGQFAAAGHVSETYARTRLLAEAVYVGLSEREALSTIESGMRKGLSEPRAIPERAGPARPARAKANGAAPEPQAEPALPTSSELALADTFSAANADLRYVASWGKWLIWREGCWRADETLAVWERARATAGEAAVAQTAVGQSHAAKATASLKTVSSILMLARADQRHAATGDQWDAEPFALNTPAGIVDLTTGDTYAHDPARHCTKITAVAPADHVPENALWLRFLNRVCGEDTALIAFLKRAAGYSLTGSTKEEAFFFLHGLGANGKSKFFEAIAGAIGDYHEYAAMETFVARRHESHPADLAKLRGARLVTAVETEEGRNWAEAKIKAVTGGDPIAARFMRQDFFTFRPQLKLWVAGNHKPGLKNVDRAMRRRLNLVPFTVTIPEAERDNDLSEKLRAEWPVVLRWMIEGCIEWQREGLHPPTAVTEATTTYFDEEDRLAQWLAECCTVDHRLNDKFSKLWDSWKTWAERAQERPGTSNAFGRLLQDRGFLQQTKGGGKRYYAGLEVADRR